MEDLLTTGNGAAIARWQTPETFSPLTPEDFARHDPDAHWVAPRGKLETAARCSLVDVAIGEQRQAHGLADGPQRVVLGQAVVAVLARAAVDGERGDATVLGDACDVSRDDRNEVICGPRLPEVSSPG